LMRRTQHPLPARSRSRPDARAHGATVASGRARTGLHSLPDAWARATVVSGRAHTLTTGCGPIGGASASATAALATSAASWGRPRASAPSSAAPARRGANTHVAAPAAAAATAAVTRPLETWRRRVRSGHARRTVASGVYCWARADLALEAGEKLLEPPARLLDVILAAARASREGAPRRAHGQPQDSTGPRRIGPE